MDEGPGLLQQGRPFIYLRTTCNAKEEVRGRALACLRIHALRSFWSRPKCSAHAPFCHACYKQIAEGARLKCSKIET